MFNAIMKKPKKPWQIEVRSKLDQDGIGYRELAKRTGISEDMIRQVMSKDNMPGVRQKICDYFDIDLRIYNLPKKGGLRDRDE